MSKNVTKEARRDAEEYMRAKLYYGKGAGNRRKAIRNKVAAKKVDPEYAREFDRIYSTLDPGKYASEAISERKRNDGKDILKKVIRDGMHVATGNPQRTSTGGRIAYEIIKMIQERAR